MSSTASAPAARARSTWYSVVTKSLKRIGRSLASRARRTFASPPRNWWGSASTESAAAPDAVSSRASASASKYGRMRPFDGLAFLSSAITCSPGPLNAAAKSRTRDAFSTSARRRADSASRMFPRAGRPPAPRNASSLAYAAPESIDRSATARPSLRLRALSAIQIAAAALTTAAMRYAPFRPPFSTPLRIIAFSSGLPPAISSTPWLSPQIRAMSISPSLTMPSRSMAKRVRPSVEISSRPSW